MQYAMVSSIAKYGQTHPKTNPWGEKKKVYIFIYKACLPLAESLAAISFPLRQDSYHIFNAALKMPRFNGFIFCYTLAGATLVLQYCCFQPIQLHWKVSFAQFDTLAAKNCNFSNLFSHKEISFSYRLVGVYKIKANAEQKKVTASQKGEKSKI